MQVKATRRGFYGRLIEVGEVFDLADDKHLGSWMEPTDPKDCARLAERMKQIGAHVRPPARAGVPPTTGPGYKNAVKLEALAPKAVPAEPEQKPATKTPKPADPPKA